MPLINAYNKEKYQSSFNNVPSFALMGLYVNFTKFENKLDRNLNYFFNLDREKGDKFLNILSSIFIFLLLLTIKF